MVAENGSGNDGFPLVRAPTRAAFSLADPDRVVIFPIRNPNPPPEETTIDLARSTGDEKERQLDRLCAFHQRYADTAPAALDRLREAVIREENVFAVLMDAVHCCSLGQITDALFEVGGQYRRNM